MAIKYGEFKFDSSGGFTGSAGKKAVKGYMRGGPTKAVQNVELAKSKAAMKFAKSRPGKYAEGGDVKGKTIEDIIEETKGIEVKAEPRRKPTIPDMTPAEERRVKATADAERKKRLQQDQYDADTEDMRENPLNKAKGGVAKMAGENKRGVQDQTIENLQRQKSNYAKGGTIAHSRTAHVPYGRATKSSSMSLPSAMAVPKTPAPKAPPSLGKIATSSNPAMMMKKGGESKVKTVMDEWKSGKLHSGSKKGPVVKSQKQAIAIALSEARKGKK